MTNDRTTELDVFLISFLTVMQFSLCLDIRLSLHTIKKNNGTVKLVKTVLKPRSVCTSYVYVFKKWNYRCDSKDLHSVCGAKEGMVAVLNCNYMTEKE